MRKQIIAFFVFLSMLFNIIPIMAEDIENKSIQTINIENIFDIALGFDMSGEMHKFDYNNEKKWLGYFRAIAEQVPDGTNFVDLGKEATAFTTNIDEIIDEKQSKSYCEDISIIKMFERAEKAFENSDESRNKIIIITTTSIDDTEAFIEKKTDLLNDGIVPFVFILNSDKQVDIEDNSYLYQCSSLPELRLSLSELYCALSEYSEAELYCALPEYSKAELYCAFSEYSEAELLQPTKDNGYTKETPITFEYVSDFKEKNKFSVFSSKGSVVASILSLYGSVPLRANTPNGSYDLTNISGEKLEKFLIGDNAAFSSGEQLTDFYDVWDYIYDEFESDGYLENINQARVILDNLKRKFPVLIEHNGTYQVVTKYNSGNDRLYLDADDSKYINLSDISSSDKVFNTYKYLMSIIPNRGINVSVSNIEESNDVNVGMNITLEYPSTYTKVGNEYPINYTITSVEYASDDSIDEETGISINRTNNPIKLSIQHSEEIDTRYILTSSLVTYTGSMPNLCNANKMIRDLLYADEDDPTLWYYRYLFKLSNLGILNGDENRNFNRDKNITRAEFVTMALRAAKINVSDPPEGKHWAYNYIAKSIELGMIRNSICTNAELDMKIEAVASETINRGEAAYILYSLFINSAENVNIPTMLYDYTTEFVNDKSTNWALEKAFTDQTTNITGTENEEAIRQMYLNNILGGFEDGECKPDNLLTRSQCSVIISKCLFELDDNVKTIQAKIQDDYSDDFNGELIKLTEGTTQICTLDTESDVDCFMFIPAETASYKIYSSGNVDLKGELYDTDKTNQISISHNTPINKDKKSTNFTVARTLEKDKIYYIKVSGENDSYGDYSIDVKLIEEPNDPYFKDQWGLLNKGLSGKAAGIDINVLPVWEYTTGKGIKVAVIDSGLDSNHDDLQNIILPGINTVHGNTDIYPINEDISYDSNGNSLNNAANEGHGTHVTGIISAVKNNKKGVSGIAPDVEIMPIKSIGNDLVSAGTQNNLSTNATLLDGIEYAVKNDANIINMSLQHFVFDSLIKDTIDNATDQLFVVCAGNDGIDLDATTNIDIYPGMYNCNNMITVASIDKEGCLSGFSNYRGNTQIAAPGEDIYSTFPNNTYVSLNGTSMATPHVTGVAALIWSYYKDLTPIEIKQRITNNVTINTNLQGMVSSNGYLNAWEAFVNNSETANLYSINSKFDNYGLIENKKNIANKKNITESSKKTNEIFVKAMNDNECIDIINEVLNGCSYEIEKQYFLSGAVLVKLESIDVADSSIDKFNARDDIKYSMPNYII